MTVESRLTFDTNILIYAVDRNAGRRHDIAKQFVAKAVFADCALTLQSLAEFFHATTRKGNLPAKEAMAFVTDWRSVFPVMAADETALNDAMEAVQDHGLSFWDALLWATARNAGCSLLVSEDFQHGRQLGGVEFVSPFNDHGREKLTAVLAQ